MEIEKFIYCLEVVPDIDIPIESKVVNALEDLALKQGVASIYKTSDSIENLEESLNTLFYNDHNFKDYAIIYLVMSGKSNTIELNDYCYSIEEISEIF